MKALILAAGLGSRLAPITDNIPKSLVSVNGTPILFKQIDNLIENGITDITIVSGYLSSVLKDRVWSKYSDIKIIENNDYDKTNNMYSAYLAKDLFSDELFMMNADVFYDCSVIKEMMALQGDNLIAVEKGQYNDESMKVVFDGYKITDISKTILQDKAYGTSIDVYKFSRTGAKKFIDKCKEYIDKKKELTLWSEVALNDALKETKFVPCNISGRWVEIDNHDDLAYAEKLFANKEA